jgi:hypothetical protein
MAHRNDDLKIKLRRKKLNKCSEALFVIIIGSK